MYIYIASNSLVAVASALMELVPWQMQIAGVYCQPFKHARMMPQNEQILGICSLMVIYWWYAEIECEFCFCNRQSFGDSTFFRDFDGFRKPSQLDKREFRHISMMSWGHLMVYTTCLILYRSLFVRFCYPAVMVPGNARLKQQKWWTGLTGMWWGRWYTKATP